MYANEPVFLQYQLTASCWENRDEGWVRSFQSARYAFLSESSLPGRSDKGKDSRSRNNKDKDCRSNGKGARRRYSESTVQHVRLLFIAIFQLDWIEESTTKEKKLNYQVMIKSVLFFALKT